jgi:hypothetical protein
LLRNDLERLPLVGGEYRTAVEAGTALRIKIDWHLLVVICTPPPAALGQTRNLADAGLVRLP